MRAGNKKLLLSVAALALLGLLIYRSRNMLHLADFSGEKLWNSIRGANPYDVLLALVLIYGCYALRALRWQIFQKNLGKADFGAIYKMTLAGFAAVFLLGRAGEPIRPLLLARKGNIPVADTFGIWVLERLFDAASTAVIASIGLLVFTSQEHLGESAGVLERAAKTTGTLLAVGVTAAIAFLVYLRLHGTEMANRRLQGWLAAHGWRATVARVILGFIRGIQTIRSWRDLSEAVFLSIIHWYLVVMVYLFVSHGFGGKLGQISVSDAMLVTAFTLAGSAVQLPGVGGGSQVACFLAYTTIFGVEKEPAAAAAILLWLITFAVCGVAGIPLLVQEGFSLGKLREMAAKEKEELAEVAARGLPGASREGESDH
jgi:uncharacterized protein (TIRG00374 family)